MIIMAAPYFFIIFFLYIQVTLHLDAPQTRQREIEGLIDAMDCYSLPNGMILTEEHEEVIHLENGRIITVVPVWKWLIAEERVMKG